MLTLTEDEIRIVSQALAHYQSHVTGVAASARNIGWNDSALIYEKKLVATEQLRERILTEVYK